MANDDLNKEINKQITETARDIEKARSELKPSFKKLIDEIKEINPELAKTTAEIRKQAKDSFAGALQANKFAKQTTDLLRVQQAGIESLDPKDFAKLKETFAEFGDADFDFEGYASMMEDQKARVKNLRRANTQLGNEENALNVLQKSLKDKEAAQAKTLASLSDKNKKEQIQVYADMNAGLEEEIKKQEEVVAKKKKLQEKESTSYDDQIKKSEDLNKRQDEVFKKLNEDSGRFGQFSEGINDLIGVDIGGFADDIVKKVNAVGKIFGQEDLFGTMFSSIQGALQGLGPKISESFSEGFSSLSGVGKDIGNFLKEGLSSAFDGIGSMIGDALGGIASAWILATGKISAGFTFVTGKLQLGMDMLMASSVGTFLKSMKKLAGRFLMLGKRLLMGAATMVANALIFIGGLMMTAASLFVAALPFIAIGVLIIGAIVGLVMAFNYMYENVEWFRNGIDWIAEKFWQVYQFLADMGVFDAIKTYIGDIFSSITGIFTGVIDFVKAAMSGDFGGMWEAVKSIFSSIKDLFLAPFKFVKNLILGEDPEGLDEAQESGLYDLDRIGNSEIDEDKVKGAPMKHLKAIVAHDDLSEDDMALIKEEIARQEAINLAAGAPPTTGQEVALGTQELAGAGAGGGVTVINQVNDNSQSSSSTSVHGGSGKTTNSDSTAGRVANNVE